jgi:hypothetical protein
MIEALPAHSQTISPFSARLKTSAPPPSEKRLDQPSGSLRLRRSRAISAAKRPPTSPCEARLARPPAASPRQSSATPTIFASVFR